MATRKRRNTVPMPIDSMQDRPAADATAAAPTAGARHPLVPPKRRNEVQMEASDDQGLLRMSGGSRGTDRRATEKKEKRGKPHRRAA
jgi:hypothetical protein